MVDVGVVDEKISASSEALKTELNAVDKKISDSKKVLKRKLSAADKKASASKKVIKRALKKERAKNTKQDSEITKLKAAMEKLKKKKSSSRHVSEYNLFVRKQIKMGRTFSQAAKQWNKYKALQKKRGRKLSAYNQFIGSQMRLGKTFKQSVSMWKLAKSGKLGRKGRTRTITKTLIRRIKSKPITKTIVRRIKSKPKIVVRRVKSKPKVIVRRLRPKLIKKTITRTRVLPAGFNASQLKQVFESVSASHSISKKDLKNAFAPDDEEIAFKIIQTYFIEIARLGFKRRLSLDEIIDAYFYALSRVSSHGAKFEDVERAVREMEMKK